MHRDYVVEQLQAGVTVATISARLADLRGLSASRSSLRRWIAGNLSELGLRERVSVPKPPAPPGSEAQIDYGKPEDGPIRRPGPGTRSGGS